MQKSDEAVDVFCENGLFNSANPSTTANKTGNRISKPLFILRDIKALSIQYKQFLHRHYLVSNS